MKSGINNKRTLRRLKWATVALPPVLAWLYETLRHSFLETELDGWVGNLLTGLVILACSLAFAQITFTLIGRLQHRLTQQNQQLKQLNQQIHEMAIVEERGRLSREMHDGLAQLLAYTMLKIDLIETLLKLGRLQEAEAELELVRKACNDGYEDVREAITGLRPEFFDGRDFLTILRELLESFGDKNTLAVSLNVQNIQAGSPQVEQLFPAASVVQLYRVVQEALSNIRKHAGATQVRVWVARHDPAQNAADSGSDPARPLTITIQDDGQGFDPARLGQGNGHFGYIIMRERIESLGGRLSVNSQPGEGTRLRIELPAIEPIIANLTDPLARFAQPVLN